MNDMEKIDNPENPTENPKKTQRFLHEKSFGFTLNVKYKAKVPREKVDRNKKKRAIVARRTSS